MSEEVIELLQLNEQTGFAYRSGYASSLLRSLVDAVEEGDQTLISSRLQAAHEYLQAVGF